MNSNIPFEQRHGINTSTPIIDDFPDTAKVALSYLLNEISSKGMLKSHGDSNDWQEITNELCRIGRITNYFDEYPTFQAETLELLRKLEWYKIFSFCERVYTHFIYESGKDRKYFTDELNLILLEENIGYTFEDGIFLRSGRKLTQKNISKMNSILANSELTPVRQHYMKAVKLFSNIPDPDYANCVKEANCALELAIEICTDKKASNNFQKAVKELSGNAPDKIPTPLAESMIKLNAYRGSAKGVGHAAMDGYKVTEYEAELFLNLVASYITYIHDSFPKEDELLPF